MNGALDVVQQLADAGVDIGVVTSGSRNRVTREMEAHGVAPLVRASVFGTDVVQKKPHPEALLHLAIAGVGRHHAGPTVA